MIKKVNHIKNLRWFINQSINYSVVNKKGYDYFKLPVSNNFIKKKYGKKLCLESLILLFHNLKEKYSKKFVGLIILIEQPDFYQSQVIAFFDKKVYKNWFKRKSEYQTWIKGKKKNLLLDELELTDYKLLKETYYKEVIHDEEISKDPIVSDLWFYR